MFCLTSIAKNSDKEKWVSSSYGITFNNAGSWNYGNDFARNVVIFGVDDNSSSHANNCKNNILVLGEGDTFGINGSFAPPEKSFSIYFIYFT